MRLREAYCSRGRGYGKEFSQQDKLASTLPFAAAVETERDILRIFESDRGTDRQLAGNPPPAAKTQVFPLERNAAVRTRLTHSLEVQQVGRYIAKEVLSRLKSCWKSMAGRADRAIRERGGDGLPDARYRQSPFGHFGEAAINDWFRQRGARRCARAAADRRSLQCRPYACMTEDIA